MGRKNDVPSRSSIDLWAKGDQPGEQEGEKLISARARSGAIRLVPIGRWARQLHQGKLDARQARIKIWHALDGVPIGRLR